MRKFCFAFVCWFVAFGAIAQEHTGDWIRLGSWNIEKLGDSQNDDSAPKALAEYIHISGVDVISLQEIGDNDDNPETRTNKQLDETFE